MKQYFPRAHVLTFGLGIMAMALRFWILLEGTDDRGLYPKNHPAWILVCLLSVAAVILVLLLSRQADLSRSYKQNFPASGLGAAGYLALACGIALVTVLHWTEGSGLLDAVTKLLSIASALLLALGGWLRQQGKQPAFYIHALPCLYFALRVFTMGRVLGTEPEFQRYLFRFLAALSMLLACYQLWGFGGNVNEGNRRKSLFWSLIAGYFCLAAIPGAQDWPIYCGGALWLLTNLCSLQPLRRRPQPASETAPEPLFQPESQDTETLLEQIHDLIDD